MQNNLSQQAERLTIGESSEYLGVSIDTLRRWEKKGVISAVRSPGGHRYFIKKDLDKLFGQKYTRVIHSPIIENKVTPTPPENTISQKNVLIPPTVTPSPTIQNISEDLTLQKNIQKPKKEISWTTIIIIGLVLFTVVDIILLMVFVTSSQPLARPVP